MRRVCQAMALAIFVVATAGAFRFCDKLVGTRMLTASFARMPPGLNI